MDSRYSAVQDQESGIVLDDLSSPRSTSPSSSRGKQKHDRVYEAIDEFHDGDESDNPLQNRKLEDPQDLPSVDIGSGTKIQCVLAIVLGIICFLLCIGFSIGYWAAVPPKHTSSGKAISRPPIIRLPKGFSGEALSFVATIILTQCLEGLAYVHSVSLRWALLKENRLVFNTNIRLLTSSKISRPNSRWANGISATLLIICYGCTSMLAIPEVDSEYGTYEDGTFINVVSLLTLGFALLSQTVLAIWCYYDNLRDIPSWSSNPLNTTVTMLKMGMVKHRKGRCMHSVQHSKNTEATPKLPSKQQPSQWQISTSSKNALRFTWTLVGLSTIWFLTILLLARSNMLSAITYMNSNGAHLPANATWHFSPNWNMVINPYTEQQYGTTYYNGVFFSLDPSERTGSGSSMSLGAALAVGLIFVCAIQGLQTMGLHCAELIVNLSRDEDSWRALNAHHTPSRWPWNRNKKNPVLSTPFWAAATSWKSNTLSMFKTLLHWLLGQSLQPSFSGSYRFGSVWFTMIYIRLLVYFVSAIIFAAIITYLGTKKPRGPMPANYGCVQTLADCVDDWSQDKNGCFWWGDKGAEVGLRHAGMSCKREELGRIKMDEVYA